MSLYGVKEIDGIPVARGEVVVRELFQVLSDVAEGEDDDSNFVGECDMWFSETPWKTYAWGYDGSERHQEEMKKMIESEWGIKVDEWEIL